MTNTTYIQKRIISVLVHDLIAAGYVMDVNDNDGDQETHLAKSADHAAIMKAIFNPELDSIDYCLDCWAKVHPGADAPEWSAGFVRLIDGNGATVIADYSTVLEGVLVRVNAFADKIDDDEEAFIVAEFETRQTMLAAVETLVAAADADGWPVGWGLVRERAVAALAKATGVA